MDCTDTPNCKRRGGNYRGRLITITQQQTLPKRRKASAKYLPIFSEKRPHNLKADDQESSQFIVPFPANHRWDDQHIMSGILLFI